MSSDEARPRRRGNWVLVAGIVWLLLSAWAFWSFYSGSAPFETLAIPISQVVLEAVFIAIWLFRIRAV
jgi:hypothetical protein